MTLLHSIARPAALVLFSLAACSSSPLSGPPDLRLGRSECVECGMIISEDRCSSGLLLLEDGRRDYRLYDDIGCMLDHEHEDLDHADILERYVHDHNSKQWIRVEDASFLFSDSKSLYTPMGSGIIAFASRADALAALASHPGQILDYQALAAARRAWMQERYGKPKCCDPLSHPDP